MIDHVHMKYRYDNLRCWSLEYYVRTVDLNESTIRKYIREHDREDIMINKSTSIYGAIQSEAEKAYLGVCYESKYMGNWTVEKDRTPAREVQAGAIKAQVSNKPLQG